MNTFKKSVLVIFTAVSLGAVASSQAFAWDDCEHSNSYSSSYNQPTYDAPPSYSYQPPRQYGHGYGYHPYHRSRYSENYGE
jgi:hypothetical protein